MKILFINAQDTRGGAAIAAYRLGNILHHQYKAENFFIVGKKHSTDANVFCTRKNQFQTFVETFTDKVMNKLGLQYQFFPFSSRAILKKARQLKPDIISLHNTHEGYFKTTLLKKLSKIAPIVWTLHDMWSFTGNAVHTFGDESWKQLKSGSGEKKIYPHIGIDTGSWLLKQKRRIYKASDLNIVTPSHWLSRLAGESPVFENKSIHTIHHGLDLNFFTPKDRLSCRNVLGISPYAKVLIFSSADDLDISPWKGGTLLVEILTALNEKTDFPIELLAVGKGQLTALDNLNNLKVHKLGYVSSEIFVTQLLSAADLFIYPTRADSFGLVLAESIACGTPAVAFNIGGCGDIIQDHYSGILIDAFNIDDFVEKTLKLLADDDGTKILSNSARQFALQHFDQKDMAKKHYDLFQSLNRSRPRVLTPVGEDT